MKVKRGQIYYADLNPVMGSEQSGIRPVVIVQNDVGNLYSPTTIVAAMTSRQEKRHLPTHIAVKTKCMSQDSIILLEQIRTIDKQRLISYVGRLDDEDMVRLDRTISISLGLSQEETANGMQTSMVILPGLYRPRNSGSEASSSDILPEDELETSEMHHHTW